MTLRSLATFASMAIVSSALPLIASPSITRAATIEEVADQQGAVGLLQGSQKPKAERCESKKRRPFALAKRGRAHAKTGRHSTDEKRGRSDEKRQRSKGKNLRHFTKEKRGRFAGRPAGSAGTSVG
jgi:hypothetical protein